MAHVVFPIVGVYFPEAEALRRWYAEEGQPSAKLATRAVGIAVIDDAQGDGERLAWSIAGLKTKGLNSSCTCVKLTTRM
jgi:hypothetical protein